jgi:hypothetical protein
MEERLFNLMVKILQIVKLLVFGHSLSVFLQVFMIFTFSVTPDEPSLRKAVLAYFQALQVKPS